MYNVIQSTVKLLYIHITNNTKTMI